MEWVNSQGRSTNAYSNTDGSLIIIQKTGLQDQMRRLIADYDFRPQIVQQVFAYCKQCKFDIPCTDTWNEIYYSGKFNPGSDNLRRFGLHDDLANEAILCPSGTSAIIQRRTNNMVYASIAKGELFYKEYARDKKSEILRFSRDDIAPLLHELVMQCVEHRGQQNIPGLIYSVLR